MKTVTEEIALQKMAAYCSTAEHCESEVSEKLLKWGLTRDAVVRIINHLVAERYIDDERYCRAYVNDKFRFSKWGKVKIAQALYQNKIASDLVRQQLNEIDSEAYLDVLRGLIAAKRKSVKGDDAYQITAKLVRFALGRGFEMDAIKCCLHAFDDEEFEE